MSNVTELLTRKKKGVAFVNKAKAFKNVRGVEQLEVLVGCMWEYAKR